MYQYVDFKHGNLILNHIRYNGCQLIVQLFWSQNSINFMLQQFILAALQFCYCSFLGPLHNHITSLLLCHLRTTGANCFGLHIHNCGLPQLIISFKWDDPFICYQLLFHTVKYNSCDEPVAESTSVYGRDWKKISQWMLLKVLLPLFGQFEKTLQYL